MKNLWEDTCAETVSAPPLAGDLTADLVIIGGGYTGCAAALEAAEQGASVVLLEARTIGHGGSGRNVGLANAGLWLPPDQVIAQMGQTAGERLNAALAVGPDRVFDLIARHDIQCEPVRNGTLHCAHAPAGMRNLKMRYDQQAARQAPVRLLEADDATIATGSKQFFGALWDKRAGTVQPLAYAKGLARAAKEAGAHIHEKSPVTRVSRDTDWLVETEIGAVRAKSLLMATNAYHNSFKGLNAAPTTPVHFFQLATAPLSDHLHDVILPGNQGCWDTGLVMTSFRKDKAGRFILGAMGQPDRLGIHETWARRALARLFPQLAGQAFEHFWSGRIGMTADYIPKILRLGDRGYAVFGYSGRGISPGSVFGTACAQALLSGSESNLPLAPVENHSEHLTRAKGIYFEAGARLVHAAGHRIQ